jgi:hypothetical protein
VDIRAKAQQVGISSPIIYLVGAMYWTFINSLFEEYIWRWFVYSKCEVLIPGKGANDNNPDLSQRQFINRQNYRFGALALSRMLTTAAKVRLIFILIHGNFII